MQLMLLQQHMVLPATCCTHPALPCKPLNAISEGVITAVVAATSVMCSCLWKPLDSLLVVSSACV
jgi:hypothetical protein